MAREREREYAATRAEFVRLIRQPEEQWTLDRAALLIAQEEYPALDLQHYLQQLDELAGTARSILPPSVGTGRPDRDAAITVLRKVLFEQEGFRGNAADYGDPRNSFLNEVLDRRLGLPITLTVVYIEVSRRLGMQAEGIGLPGHFLVGCPPDQPGDSMRYVDPYHGGRELTVGDCQALFEAITGGPVPFDEAVMLAPVTKRSLLARLLRNLKITHVNRSQFRRALAAVERILLLEPVADEVRDRGVILARMGQLNAAWFDLQTYIQAAPQASDTERVRTLATQLWQQLGRTN